MQRGARRTARYGLLALAGAAIFALPQLVLGQPYPDDGLVPCVGGGPQSCGFCDFIDLIQNIINFLVYLATFAATLLFVYAGFLYVTAAGNASQVSKAHGVFTNVLIGFVILLAAWLIIDTIMKAFVADDFFSHAGPWNNPPCAETTNIEDAPISDPDQPVTPTDPTEPSDSPAAQQKAEEEQALREELRSEGVAVHRDDHCPVNTAYQETDGCTDLSGLDSSAIADIKSEEDECSAQLGSCNFIVTGGSELGHEPCTEPSEYNNPDANNCRAPGSHGGGDKYDVDDTASVNQYVRGSAEEDTPSGNFEQGTCPDGRSGYVNAQTGNCWVHEGNHWDVQDI